MHVVRFEPHRVVHCQLDTCPLTGPNHSVGLAQVHRHRLFAEDGAHARLRCGQCRFNVLMVTRADAEDVQLLLGEHFGVVGVSPLHAPLFPESPQRLRHNVGRRHQVYATGGPVATGVNACDVAATDDPCSVIGHSCLSATSLHLKWPSPRAASRTLHGYLSPIDCDRLLLAEAQLLV